MFKGTKQNKHRQASLFAAFFGQLTRHQGNIVLLMDNIHRGHPVEANIESIGGNAKIKPYSQ